MKELRATLRSPAIRRVVLAFATFNFAEWATWTAVLVYAFERGGATESGLVAFTMLVPAAVVAPVVASIGGRYRRERQLLAAYVTQAVVMRMNRSRPAASMTVSRSESRAASEKSSTSQSDIPKPRSS